MLSGLSKILLVSLTVFSLSKPFIILYQKYKICSDYIKYLFCTAVENPVELRKAKLPLECQL